MLRLLGCALWCGAFVWLSACLNNRQAQAMRVQERLLSFLRYVRAEMACFAKPLGDIYADFEDKALEECGFLPCLREKGFAFALSHLCQTHLIGNRQAQPLFTLAERLGKQFISEELPMIDRTLLAYEEMLHQMRAEAPHRRKLTQTVVLSGGALVVLLLL